MISIRFSEKFIRQFYKNVDEGAFKPEEILGLQKNKIMYYPFITDKGFQDIRSIFKHSDKENEELKNYYKKYVRPSDSTWAKALKIAKVVNRRTIYTPDKIKFGQTEYWARPIEVHHDKRDDCDGYAALIVHVLRLLGARPWEVFVWAGDVAFKNGRAAGGHANVLVFNPATFQFYPLEGSFYPTDSIREYGSIPHPYHPRYPKTWFVVNDTYSFGNGFKMQFVK